MTTRDPPVGSPFAGDSEMARLLRDLDWSKTDVGPPETWPPGLRAAVNIVLGSRFPMFVWWGPNMTNFYNDAYRPMLGDRKHPQWLGLSARDCWYEVWDAVGPLTDKVMKEGEATFSENLLLVMERNGYTEEAYFTFSYSPIHAPDGAVDGLFSAVFENTQRVLGERRLSALRELSAQATSVEEALTTAAAVIERFAADIPFVHLYSLGPDGATVRVAATGAAGGLQAPDCTRLQRGEQSAFVFDLPPDTHSGPWPEPVTSAYAVAIPAAGRGTPAEVAVLGISPRRAFDDAYRSFFDLVAGRIGAILDTARAYEEERRRAEALAELDHAKTAFFSNVSHEFRTPLTLMLGPLDDLAGGAALDGHQRGLVDIARRNGRRLQRLVNTLLDFSRIEAGRMQAQYEPVDLSSVTADLASMFRAAFGRAGLDLAVDCEQLPEEVWIDRDLWEKIVMNLVSNAFKFTFAGSVTVALRGSAGAAVLTVRDTGVGIRPQELAHLFERFHRVENMRARTHEGSGIGLALVQELVGLQGGTIRVESAVDKGTTFTVSVPFGTAHLPPAHLREAAPAPAVSAAAHAYVEDAQGWLSGDAPETETLPPAAETGGHSRPLVLVADDNADMREYITRLLSPRWQVLTVANGREALEAARAMQPALVLTDVMMPELDGSALLRELRADARTHNIPVVMLSARAGQEASIEGLAAGADDYIVKPFTAADLIARVEARLEMANARKHGEEQWRTLAEALPALVFSASPGGYVNYYSKRYLDYTGYDAATLAGNGWDIIVHPDDFAAVAAEWAEAVATGRSVLIEFRLRRHDGVYRWHLGLGEPVRDRAGHIILWVGASVDIDDRKRAEEELRAVNAAKDDFLGLVSHELRTPLTTILGNAQILERDDERIGADDRRDSVRDISLNASRLARIIEDMLALARLDRGHAAETEPVSLPPIIEQCARALERARPDRRVRLSLERDLPLVEANPDYLSQVLGNLLSNAAKYSPPDAPIEVESARDGDYVVTRIMDRGRGISGSEVERLFSPFERGRGAEAQEGLGVGLTVCKRLVEAMHGTINVRQRDGAGTIFEFTLPLSRE